MNAARWLRVITLGIGASLLKCAGPAPVARGDDGATKAQADHFQEQIVPLLSRHCLECHDSSVKKGRLDLSRKSGALAGGKNGKAIVPGKASESLLWKRVESDEMPEDRPPLSAQEKKLLRDWIDSGAGWTTKIIDAFAHKPDPRATQSWPRRLTVPEYIETVRSAVGVDIANEARQLLPRDLRADGFSNTAYNLNIDLAHVEAYARLAEIIVSRMDVPTFAARYSSAQQLDDSAMRPLISTMGKWILRGPLEEREIASFLAIPRAVAKENADFSEAVKCILEAMLQSPRFIYRIERQNADTTAHRLSGYELASRLSYILWGAPPDAELMRAADAGELADPKLVGSQVKRMLDDRRAIDQSGRFISQWLDLDRLDNLRPDRRHFPQWDTGLAEDMRQETLAFFEEIAWKQNRPLSDLLNARFTLASPRLAAHYGLKRNNRPAGGTDRLQLLYTFEEGKGAVVRDASGAGAAIELKIDKAAAVKWANGGLSMDVATLVATPQPPKRVIDALVSANALSLEAWITPAETRQTGPARILTLSAGPSQRNFTLGQDGDRYEVRLRTSRTDANGLPPVRSAAGAARDRATHVVYTRNAQGTAALYLDGQPVAQEQVPGDFSTWDPAFRLAMGNEPTRERPWHGTLHLLAVYSRALTPDEIATHAQNLSRYDLTSNPSRGGLLTHGSVLTIGGDEASMVERGLFVLKDLLYSGVGSPPPGVDTTPKPTRLGMTQRLMAEARLADASCVGCHSRFEPLAFGLEKFDGIGAHRQKDHHGNALREDGEILFPGEEKPIPYKSSAELMDLLASNNRVRMNFTRKLAQFALGRPLMNSDAASIEEIHARAMKHGGTYTALITAVVTSDLVQMTRTENAR